MVKSMPTVKAAQLETACTDCLRDTASGCKDRGHPRLIPRTSISPPPVIAYIHS